MMDKLTELEATIQVGTAALPTIRCWTCGRQNPGYFTGYRQDTFWMDADHAMVGPRYWTCSCGQKHQIPDPPVPAPAP